MVLIDYIDLKEKKSWRQKWYLLRIKTEKTNKSDGTNGSLWQYTLNRLKEGMVKMVLIDYKG